MKLQDKSTTILDYVMVSLLTEMSCIRGLAYEFSKGKNIDSDRVATFIMEFQVPMLDEKD